ncbi:MAG: divergent polysaccharide deacetylase family protein, partial [Micavibrio sp.]|nr:divergent polysaccharide deacetylase family protein [Micavibrio sp.]
NKLNWIMAQAQGYVGLVTPYQPAFMKSENDVRPVMNEIYTRGLGFIDGATTLSPPPQKFSYANGAIYRNTDAWIDVPSTPEHMAAALRQLEVAAQSGGSAIGMIHSTPEGLKALQTWIDGLPQKNITLTPLSAQLLKAK